MRGLISLAGRLSQCACGYDRGRERTLDGADDVGVKVARVALIAHEKGVLVDLVAAIERARRVGEDRSEVGLELGSIEMRALVGRDLDSL